MSAPHSRPDAPRAISAPSAAQPPDEPGADKPLFPAGTVIADAYEVRSILGAGGMGQVFDAYDKNLSRRVAIKANFPETHARYTIRVEARALAAVRHPGVVTVYAFGTHESIDYMVMEHVAGVTLTHHLHRLDESTLPITERLDILIAVADGLAAIHRAGISHGDVKLENVLLAASGRVVLTDLGLVRAAYEPDEGIVAGTPAYMAPEIVSSDFKNAGWNLVDEYAFGVLAYRVLSGAYPFDADSDLEVVLLHATAPIPKLEDAVRGIPKRLSELVTQLLAKDPNDRPATMDAVVWQLRAAREEVARADGTAAPPLSVLVIDDDADIARLVAMYVKQAAPNADIKLAKNADEALAVFRKKPPRLVFLDLMMPKTNGLELFTYLRGVHLVDASTVVAMSAGGNDDDVQLMLELGAHDFIPKGPELRGRVNKIVASLATSLSSDAPPASVR
ncbi:MAG: protein kinase [Deltaproteobacteria bacterium]|nr:protein kinase [Deltaproteobacteria bacterium]